MISKGNLFFYPKYLLKVVLFITKNIKSKFVVTDSQIKSGPNFENFSFCICTVLRKSFPLQKSNSNRIQIFFRIEVHTLCDVKPCKKKKVFTKKHFCSPLIIILQPQIPSRPLKSLEFFSRARDNRGFKVESDFPRRFTFELRAMKRSKTPKGAD